VSVFPFIRRRRLGRTATSPRRATCSRSPGPPATSGPTTGRRAAGSTTLPLREPIQVIYDESRGTYGWPRVHRALRADGVHASRKRVARIMRQKGLAGPCRRRWTKTTTPDPEAAAVDLLMEAYTCRNHSN
jgi:transposase InsO family protein